MKYVIVGGVAGGAAVAARIRRNDEHAEVRIFERGEYISYANCGLPYYLGEVISERERLFVETPESFKENLNIDVKNFSEVTAVNKDKKTVSVKDLNSGREYEEAYDKLILSPGAEPFRPPIPGMDHKHIFAVRNVPDIDKVKKWVDTGKAKRAVVVGAGFIGMEVAENLHHRGLQVAVIELADQVMAPLDFEMASLVHEHMKHKKVGLYLKDGVKSFTSAGDSGDAVTVELNSGESLEADLVILSIGVKPETKLAVDTGLEVNRGIIVNEYMETSAQDIYALGDAVEMIWPVTGKSGMTPLAGPAGKQARILADTLVYGKKKKYPGAIGTAIAKIFDLTIASTGVAQKTLDREGIKNTAVTTHAHSHAGYYPDAMPMTLKLVYNPEDGKIQGAQIVGYDGVDKRIEMIAAVLRFGGTIDDLTSLEQAYAPPYSSSKDPVNILGFTAENAFLGRSTHTTWRELKEKIDAKDRDLFLLDVRMEDEFAIKTLEGAVNIPKHEFRGRLAEIPKDKDIVLFCNVGLRSYLLERVLLQNGYDRVSILSGGLKIYDAATAVQENRTVFVNRDMDVEPTATADTHNFEFKTINVDASGLQCPGPIMKLKTSIDSIEAGDRIVEKATDPGFANDVESWCNMTGNKLIRLEESGGKVEAVIEKKDKSAVAPSTLPEGVVLEDKGNKTTLICFSDDMDKAIATLVIANGALAAGKEVTIFFTFWGLSVIKKQRKPRVKKTFLGRMFSMMLPSHINKLGLSKMNMGGMGAAMMKGIMKAQKIGALQTMLDSAVDNGMNIIACQMSMDVMGVKREELIEEANIGGVANYLEAASKAGINLFI